MSAGDAVLTALERRGAAIFVPPPKVGLVLVGFDSTRTSQVVAEVDRWRAIYPGRVTPCLVANAPVMTAPAGWSHARGSNVAQEFSGFDEGVFAVGAGPMVWVFLNDRYGAYPGTGLADLTSAVLLLAKEQLVVLGHFDVLGVPVLKGGDVLRGYIRSNFFVLGDAALRALGRLTSFDTAEGETMFPAEWPGALSAVDQTSLDPAYLDHLAEWLTGRGERLKTHWYRASDDPVQRLILRRKAVAILNEHLLAERLLAGGIVGVDVRRAFRAAALQRSPALLSAEVGRWHGTMPSLDSRRERLRLILASGRAVLGSYRR